MASSAFHGINDAHSTHTHTQTCTHKFQKGKKSEFGKKINFTSKLRGRMITPFLLGSEVVPCTSWVKKKPVLKKKKIVNAIVY